MPRSVGRAAGRRFIFGRIQELPTQTFLKSIHLSTIFKIAAFVTFLVLAHFAVYWVVAALDLGIVPSNAALVHRMITVSAVAYTILLAIPFVPGVEIAVALIVMLGPEIVPLVYVCTLLGLTLSYGIGRLVPISGMINMLDRLQLTRASALIRKIIPMKRHEPLAFLLSQSPNRYVPFLLKHRYIALAVAVNLPGNFIIGGGGGIAMTAGISRLFTTTGFIATIAIAVLPIPLAVHFFGSQLLTQ